jgi:hypothetical protein
MRTPIHIPAPALRAALTLAVLLAPACDPTGPPLLTTTVDFETVGEGEQVRAQYRSLGVEFVTSAAVCGLICTVPESERWTIPCEALPTVRRFDGGPSGRRVADIRAGSGEFTSNAVCARLDRPAVWLRVRGRNARGTPADVTLRAVNAAGDEIDQVEYTLEPSPGFLNVQTIPFEPPIAGFVLTGSRQASLVIDDVSFDVRR